MSRPIRYLVLWPTMACNLECVYCYRPVDRGGRMSMHIARRAVELAARGGLPFHLQFAGGEPTLMPDLVTGVVQQVRAARMPATIGLQTNATHITESLAQELARLDVQVGVSVDGRPDVNERMRGQTDRTFTGLRTLLEAGCRVRVTSVLTSINAARLGELALWLAAAGPVDGLALDPLLLRGAGAGCVALLPEPPEVRTGVTALCQSLDWLRRSGMGTIAWREQELVRRALQRPESDRTTESGHLLPLVGQAPGWGAFCHAARGESLAVAPDGGVYPCSQTAGDPTLRCGSVGDVDWDCLASHFRHVRLTDVASGCERCALRGRCPGDCPSRIQSNLGTDPIVCTIYQSITQYESDRP